MTSLKSTYNQNPDDQPLVVKEEHIEQAFIAKLRNLKYTHRPDIRDRDELEANFREKFQRLNAVTLSDSEFDRLLDLITTPDVYKSAETLRTINSFERDDGTPLNFSLVNIKDWCKNDFEIVSQLRINTRSSHHRYDVILLINGIPCVQIELKTLEISPRRAMQQIVDYKADPGNGYTTTLLSFMQLFIVSNRTNTYYFANNNSRHFAFDAKELFLPVYQWADRDNKKITHLDCFAEAFLPKCTLGHMINRYMVLVASEQKLLMMRPYQIYAVKDIVDCIHQNSGNGYIWHTTGSGKTLTSFKASTLLKDNPDIEKCLFVVDRKDLDRQTREEFNKFQENCVEENTNTHTLVRRLLSTDYADKVIVTTIQKLGLALDANSKRNRGRKERKQQTYKDILIPLADKRIAIIFDECHRSQFGDNHKAIKDFFPNSQLFGFTGTPIFEENSTVRQINGEEATYRTTEDIFAQELHKYTITHAIEDKNVLKFHVDYYKVEGASSSQPQVAGVSSSQVWENCGQDAPASWEFFNPSTEIDIRTGGDLPHWEQGSVWYFVTFRLADALPQAVVEKLKEDRDHWKQTHDLDNLTREEIAEYHRFFSERYEALLNAGSGSCVLRDPQIAKTVDDALQHFEGQRYELDEYVIMPNHVHLLVKPAAGHKLVDILHSWKSFTANQINQRLGQTGQLWQHESYDHIVRHDCAMDAIRRYIRENPEAGASSPQLNVAGASSSNAKVTEASRPKAGKTRELEAPATKQAIIEAILERHDQTTAARKFNALFATASINDAIAYHKLFTTFQTEKQAADPEFRPLNIACVFSPPADGDQDVRQLQEDLPQEKADNKEKPNEKKKALTAIIAAYNTRYGTNHRLSEFDAYYQDVQDRIKAQKFPTADLRKANPKAPAHKIDITIVVDMLLTGFDSKYLNTLYVDKNLKYHGLIQAFSRTNRVLNDSKPHGHIFDFRQQQDAVDEAIRMFSGEQADKSKEIWLVDPAPTVIEKLDAAVRQLDDFMQSQGLSCAPEDVPKLQGDIARAQFIKTFKEVQRLKTQLDQYTDLQPEQQAKIEAVLPTDTHRAFKGVYIDTARKLKQERDTGGPDIPPEVDELDFEFVLFASATIDYDYIMELVAKADGTAPGKQKMTREQLVALIASDANFADQRELLEKYIRQLDLGQGRTKEEILDGYEAFKDEEETRELQRIAQTHGLAPDALKAFVGEILRRLVFDGERLTDLMAPLNLGWKDRRQRELSLMADLVPLLKQRANGQEISGLSGYEN